MADHAKGVCGQVRLHASVSTIVQHLPQDLQVFMAQHPAIRIELEESTSREIVQAVVENRADLGIFGGNLPMPGLVVLPYRSDTLVAIAPVDHPIAGKASVTFAEMAEFELIGPQKGSFLDGLVQRAAADLDRRLKMKIQVNGFETVRSMVEAQLGIGLVPEHFAERHLTAGRIVAVPLDEDWATRHWKICVRDVASLPPPVRLLVRHLSPDAVEKRGRILRVAEATKLAVA
jgi:DNA-binding transcriptional LysR family regulator